MAPPDADPDLSASPPEAVEADNISPLPDVIIHHIFCFLPFLDLVKTSVLSKQWRLPWTSTPNINLSFPSLPSSRVALLISSALSLCTATKVEKFYLDASSYIPTELDGWFRFAAARHVEDASVVFRHSCMLPRILCDCPLLVSLRVSNGFFPWDFSVHWPSLKKLCIDGILASTGLWDNDGIMKIMKGCPVLESLTLRSSPLESCRLRIDSRSLKELVIEADHILSLNILAPNLLLLRLSGGFVFCPCLLRVPSLAEAELNFHKPTALRWKFPDDFKSHLLKLQHVTKVTFGSWCLQVLSTTGVKGRPYLSSRWRNIVVYTTVCKCELQGIAVLLQSSPLLERLAICNPKSNNATEKRFPKLRDFVEKQFRRSRKDFHCVANQLKRVEIVGFEFGNEKSKLLLSLAKFLHGEAVESEKMTIHAD